MGLVVVRAMIIIVPLIAAIVLNAISFLVTVLDPVTRVSIVNDISKVLFTLTLIALTRR
jgi:hypothetical protein